MFSREQKFLTGRIRLSIPLWDECGLVVCRVENSLARGIELME
jgi:hypothetical protein